MAFNLVALHDAITAKVKAALPNTPVIEDGLPDEVSVPRDTDGQMIPYIILRYSPLREETYDGGSFAGIRWGEYFATMDIMTCAPLGRMSRQMLDVVCDTLLGFDPGDGGEMAIEGGGSLFAVTANEVRPLQYVCTSRMRFNVNGRNIGVPLTPTP